MGRILELEHVGFYYGAFRAIDDVSLHMEAGVYGLLGPNGAGKTTLLKIILGFLNPLSGTGQVLGFDISKDRKLMRRHIGYMPESECLIPGMDAVTLTTYLGELSGMPHQEAVKRAHEVLYYVGLEEARYRQVETYSSGMQQRLKLAGALVHDPRLLLLDEPTSGMDPGGRKEMLGLIRNIAESKAMNIIISSHLLPDIEATCEKVIILNKGRVVHQQSVSSAGTQRYNRYELRIKGDADRFIDRLQAMECRVETNDRGLLVVMLSLKHSVMDLFRLAVEEGMQIRHFRQSRTTLTDTFVKAVGADDGN